MTPTPTNADDVTVMGTYDEAEAEFMAKVDAWIACRQPVMANAATLKKLDAQEREAGFRLNNAAAVLGWHIRRHAHQSTGAVERLRESLDDLQRAEAAYRKAHDLHGDADRYTGRMWDLMRRAGDKARAALAIKGGE
jgi:hypothetical protein